MIDAHRIVFNGMDSLDFDITPHLSFDGDNGGSASFLNRESIHSEHYDGSFRRIHSYKYNEVLSPTFTFLKQNFSDFDEVENRKILSWLTGSDKPGWIEIYKDDSNVVSYRLFGNFTETEVYKLGNGRVIGYVATFESSAPYAYSRKFIYPEVHATTVVISNNDETNDYLDVDGTKSFKITCNTDEYNKLIYPKVVIDFKGKTDIYIPVSKKPESGEYMIPNTIYTFEEDGAQKQFISISAGSISERAYTMSVNVNADLNSLQEEAAQKNIRYFHVVDGRYHTIRIIEDSEWKIITKTGAAVKINTPYITNDEGIIIKGASLDEEITLDGTNKVISVAKYQDDGTKKDDGVRIMGDDFNWEWLPLAYGGNDITITGNCRVQIQWIEPRKVGSL